MKTSRLWTVVVVQFLGLVAVSYYTTGLVFERAWLRQAYFEQQGLTTQAMRTAEDAIGIAEQYAAEVEALKRAQFRARTTEYIRSVNPDAPAEEIVEAVLQASEITGIDPSWLLAKIKQESYFDPQAVSRTGCRGLAQLCRAAMQDVGLDEAQVFDVQANALAGARYLRMLLDRTGGDMRRALIRYNGNDDPLFVQRIERHRARLLRVVG